MTLNQKKPLCPAIIKSFATLAIILSTNISWSAGEPMAKEEHNKHILSKSIHKTTPPPLMEHEDKHVLNKFIHSAPTKKKNKDKHPAMHHYKQISEAELQRIINTLPPQDKESLAKIKEKIAGWPDEIFTEVRIYNDFLAAANQEAEKRYNKLSPSAKQALETERALKDTLSSNTIAILSQIHVDGD